MRSLAKEVASNFITRFQENEAQDQQEVIIATPRSQENDAQAQQQALIATPPTPQEMISIVPEEPELQYYKLKKLNGI